MSREQHRRCSRLIGLPLPLWPMTIILSFIGFTNAELPSIIEEPQIICSLGLFEGEE